MMRYATIQQQAKATHGFLVVYSHHVSEKRFTQFLVGKSPTTYLDVSEASFS
jgi:hypothetical protein